MEKMSSSSKKHTDWNALKELVYNKAVILGYHKADLSQADDLYMMRFITGITFAMKDRDCCMDYIGMDSHEDDFLIRGRTDEPGYWKLPYSMAECFARTIIRLLDYAGMKKIELNPDKFIPYISSEVTIYENCYAIIARMVQKRYLNQFSEMVNGAISDILELGNIENFNLLELLKFKVKFEDMNLFNYYWQTHDVPGQPLFSDLAE